MLKLILTTQFEKDIQKAKKQKKNIDLLLDVIDKLLKQKPLDAKYRNHRLKGSYHQHLECHIQPDWLLIYKKTEKELICERLGSHSELFK